MSLGDRQAAGSHAHPSRFRLAPAAFLTQTVQIAGKDGSPPRTLKFEIWCVVSARVRSSCCPYASLDDSRHQGHRRTGAYVCRHSERATATATRH